MKTMTFVSLLTVTLFSLQAGAAKKSDDAYWAETGMNLQYVEKSQLLSSMVCYQSIKHFRGCVKALNVLATAADEKIKVIASIAASNPNLKVELLDAKPSAISIAKITAASETAQKLTLKQYVELQTDVTKSMNDGLAWAFGLSQSNPVDFSALYKTVLAKTHMDKEREAGIAGNMISAFYSEAIDPHARLQPIQEMRDQSSDASEKMVGIGVTLQMIGDTAAIAGLIENGPAAQSGILPGDVIVKVDNESMRNLKSLDDLVKKVRGQENTKVIVTVSRDGKELDLPIIRRAVTLENVSASMISDREKSIGYIKLRSFVDEHACDVISAKVSEFQKAGAKGFILDLRGNPGGLLDQAVCIGSLFVGNKVVVMKKDPNDPNAEFEKEALDRAAITDLPMVTLIDAGSASASEVVSGALQDHQRSWILGERSFGKGSVQSGGQWRGNPKVMIWVTTERFYQPTGRTNQIVGILPDLEVPAKPDATDDDRFALREKDEFFGALDAIGAPWVQPRPDEAKSLQDCVSSSGQAKQLLKKFSLRPSQMDYQVLVAEDALACQIK